MHSCSVTAGCSGTIWLTPLLGEQDVRRMIEAGTRPTLLIGSTSDPTWAEPPRTAGGVRQLVVEGLDHGLEAAGSVARSLAVLGQVAAAIDEFLAEAERAGGHGQVSAMTGSSAFHSGAQHLAASLIRATELSHQRGVRERVERHVGRDFTL